VKLKRHGAVLALAATSALLVSACGAANETSNPAGGNLSGTIAGAGASSQAAAMQAWIAGFTTVAPNVTVNYDPVGSGGGREQFIAGGTVFAGTDAYLKTDELAKAKQRCGGDVVEVPLYISPIAIVYKLDGVPALNLRPATIAGIFAQKITNWNDPATAADNPGVTLPDLRITPVHRSDKSGTTENFAEYLKTVAPGVWTFTVSGDWPAPGGAAAQGTSGLVGAVKAGNGTIGYADASQAADLTIASVGVGGSFVKPTAEAASAVVQASTRVQGRGDHSFAYDLARDTTQAGTYPIVLVSYNLACGTYSNPADGNLVRAFFTYMASKEGQESAAKNAGSAPISDVMRAQLQPAIDAIGAAGS
jgi:phosphate transport system substrate-binding protein